MHPKYRFKSARDYITYLPIIYEHSTIMSKSTRANPRLSLDGAVGSSSNQQSTTKTSKARAVRSNATSWAQDEEDDYEFVEKPAKEPKKSGDSKLKSLKEAVKKAVGVGKISSDPRS